MYDSNPTTVEKIISAASYLTMGIVGFITLIILTIQKAYIKPFLKYHILQSIFLSVLMFISQFIINIISTVGLSIPFVKDFLEIVLTLLFAPIFVGFSMVTLLVLSLLLYFAIGAILGKFSYFPWVSDNVRQMI